ncbi:MAG: efflux RND transporter permease subunit [Chromatiales bacterium]|mgnify:CR=1 FL=1|nr:efflux RND transporter permease subunit [Chromatiales bacterium]
MNVSLWGIRNPAGAVIIFVALCVAGLYGLRQLPISTLPDFTVPQITVTVTLNGATPAQLETDVTRKVEDAVASIANIDKLHSTITEGRSQTRIQFLLGHDMSRTLEEVRDAVDRIRIDLPQNIDEPVVARVNTIGGAVLTYAVLSKNLAPDELSWFVDDTVRKALFDVPGVGGVTRIGGFDREIRVDLRPDALQAYGLTAGTLSDQLARIQVEQPGGRTTVGGSEQSVRTVATVRTAAALANYPLSLPDGRVVRLSAVATVTDGFAEPKDVALLNGQPVVSFSVQRAHSTSEVGVGRSIRERVARLAADHPELSFVEVASAVEPAENSYNASVAMLLEGTVLAVVVVWIFLRDWRATWICAVALPLSVIPTFAMMHWFGFSLNLLSLLAFAVVIGILVDDAIVEVENIARHRAMGKSARQAAIDAADEIGIAVIATSATLVAVFVPVAMIGGQVGLFFREFGWTAATAVLCSLLVARLLTPMLAAQFMQSAGEAIPESGWMPGYIRWVEAALRHRKRTLLLAFAVFLGSLALVPLIPTTFLPPGSGTRTEVSLELPPGASLRETTEVAEQARQLVLQVPEVDSVYARIGAVANMGYEGGFLGDLRKAGLIISFKRDHKRSVPELEAELRKRLGDLPGVRSSFVAVGPGKLFEIILAGNDAELLTAAARDVEAAVRTLPGLGSVSSTASLLQPEMIITPDPARAADLGVTTVDIATAARVATSGDFTQRLAKLNLAERQIPIRVQVAERALGDVGLLSKLRIPTRDGSVPLSAVATIREGSGPAQIDRLNRERNIRVTAELNGLPVGTVLKEVRALPALRNLPAGVRVLPSGDAEALGELLFGFGMSILAGLVSIYVVLLLLFGSASQPWVILAAVPLCGAGAFGGLLLTGYALSLPSLIGLLMLTGVATKNSILIVDYAIIGERDQGLSRREAILEACRKRARPVIMTTVAMGAGMLPIALGFGADGNFRAPLGVSVIGGLLTSTLLSLVVVPAAYSLVADMVGRWRKPV